MECSAPASGSGAAAAVALGVDPGEQPGDDKEFEDEKHMQIHVTIDNISEDTMLKIRRFRDSAKRMVNVHIKLDVEPASETQLVAMMTDSIVNKMKGKSFSDDTGATVFKNFVHITYDPKVAGRASTAPHLRVPPLRNNGGHIQKMIGAAIRARSNGEERLDDGDLYVLFDGMKHGNEKDLTTQPFRNTEGAPLTRHVRVVRVMYSEASLRDRSSHEN